MVMNRLAGEVPPERVVEMLEAGAQPLKDLIAALHTKLAGRRARAPARLGPGRRGRQRVQLGWRCSGDLDAGRVRLLTLGVRVAIQLRRTGRTGLIGLRVGAGVADWGERLPFVAGNGRTGAASPVLVLGDQLEPIDALDIGGSPIILLAAAGGLAVFAAQLGMGESWRIGVSDEERTDLVTGGAGSHSVATDLYVDDRRMDGIRCCWCRPGSGSPPSRSPATGLEYSGALSWRSPTCCAPMAMPTVRLRLQVGRFVPEWARSPRRARARPPGPDAASSIASTSILKPIPSSRRHLLALVECLARASLRPRPRRLAPSREGARRPAEATRSMPRGRSWRRGPPPQRLRDPVHRQQRLGVEG